MKNATRFTSTVTLSGLVATIVLYWGQPNAQEAAPQAGGPPITAAVIVEKTILETQEFTGRLEAVEHIEIRPRVSGFISKVGFEPGAEVKKGQVLFVIDPRPYQAEARRTEAVALAAHAKAELARKEFVRAEKLAVEKAISQREADEMAASVKELDASARAAQAASDTSRLNLGFTEVIAPINGRVSKAEVTLGNLVDANVVLTSLVSNGPIYASFNGDEDTYLRVGPLARMGKVVPVHIGLANETAFPHQGRLEFVDNRIDPATGSVRMRAIFKNADGALAPGLFARVQLTGGNRTGGATRVALIAERAVGTDQNRKFVYVVSSDGKAEYRAVKLGAMADGLRIVREGVKPGEKVIVNGLQRVRPGVPVTAQIVPMDEKLTVLGAAKAKDSKRDDVTIAKAETAAK